jgi:nucleoside-diphosphate-sugar epimerase
MHVLVTGATGKVGNAIAAALLERGDQVRALVRDPERAAEVVPSGVELLRGDATEPSSLPPAVEGCELVYNAMGLPEQWFADEGIFDRVNAVGSGDLARAAATAGVRRFVHTSTNDIFHADQGASFDESRVADYPKGTAYERSKQRAEELVLEHRGPMEIVITNPTGVYGPGPSSSHTLENGLFEPLVKKKLPALVPGGLGLVFVDGVVQGHLAAADKGKDGERYILTDEYADLRHLAEEVVRIAGRGRVPPTMPVPAAKVFAAVGEGVSKLIRKPPMLARGQLTFFQWQARADSTKAQRELGFVPTPLEQGLRKTLEAMGLLDGGHQGSDIKEAA